LSVGVVGGARVVEGKVDVMLTLETIRDALDFLQNPNAITFVTLRPRPRPPPRPLAVPLLGTIGGDATVSLMMECRRFRKVDQKERCFLTSV